ncbi:hypothetical protein FJT64_012974 [Amphibalanus amphitrite]|uniref:Uncharacterized protein n=1 Tax=Amphibalanus amphitrite TaxID=1232801 RepID=A0A6A4VE45_AMPAM|nr:hypothetical protein FJT64_012974 [Amphibalanus amphitrite]
MARARAPLLWAVVAAAVTVAGGQSTEAACGTGPSVAATVFAVLLLLALAALGVVMYQYIWKPRHYIDVAHRLGNKNRSGTRPVIVKFTRFEKRQELYAARKRIRSAELGRGSPITATEAENVFIADSLTKHNQSIMFAARQLKRKGKLFATWSDTGKLKVRVTSEAPTKIIKSLADLQKLVGDDPALEPAPETAEPGRASANRPDLSAAGEEGDGFRPVPGRGGSGRKQK